MNSIISDVSKNLDEEALIANIILLCSQETVNPPGNEYLLNKPLTEIYKSIGCQEITIVEKSKGRSNVIGRLKGNRPGKVLAIVGHSDVVPTLNQKWKTNPFEPFISKGRIYGRGTIDNKGPFAAALEGVRIFNSIVSNDFAGEILLISAADEESGSKYGIRYLFEEVGLKCDYAIIPDGGEFQHAIYGEMGILQLEFESKGKAFHGSMPEFGVNAIAPIAKLYLDLHHTDWKDIEGDGEFENIVLNLGMINGGTAPNIVPDKASLNAMWRYPLKKKGDRQTIDKKILSRVEICLGVIKEGYKDVSIRYKVLHKSDPYLGKKESKMFKFAQESAKELGMKIPTLKTIRAETVGKYINQACGADILVNGPMDGSVKLMHQANEYANIKALKDFARYIALLIFNLQKK